MESLRIEFWLKEIAKEDIAVRTYDPYEDDVRSILMDACRELASFGEFVVSGFGQDKWPVDVGTDLSILLEQLPDVISAINSGRPTEIDFYEQGVERKIIFVPFGENYIATCKSQTMWQPSSETIVVQNTVLKEMLVAVQLTFMIGLEKLLPSLAKHKWILEWLMAE